MASIHPATQSPRRVRADRDVPWAALLGILPCNIRACGIFHTPFPSNCSLEFLAAHAHWHAHFRDCCCSGTLLSSVIEGFSVATIQQYPSNENYSLVDNVSLLCRQDVSMAVSV